MEYKILIDNNIDATYIVNLLTDARGNPNQKRLLNEVSVVITDGNRNLTKYTHAKFIIVMGNTNKAKFPNDKYILRDGDNDYKLYQHVEYNLAEIVDSPKNCDLWFRNVGSSAGTFSLPGSCAHAKGYYYIVLSDQNMIHELLNLPKSNRRGLQPMISKYDVIAFLNMKLSQRLTL